jgi:hypothetical protein
VHRHNSFLSRAPCLFLAKILANSALPKWWLRCLGASRSSNFVALPILRSNHTLCKTTQRRHLSRERRSLKPGCWLMLTNHTFCGDTTVPRANLTGLPTGGWVTNRVERCLSVQVIRAQR